MMNNTNNHFSFWKPRKTPWTLRSSSRSITQEELAKRPDPFSLLGGLEDGKYGWLADDVKRLCKLKQDCSNGSISLEDTEADKKEPAKSAHVLTIDSDDEESVTPLDKRAKKLKEVTLVDDSSPGSDTSLQGYEEENSSRNSYSTETPPNEDAKLDEIWRQMAFAQESDKVPVETSQGNDHKQVEDCEHSFIVKDDIGEVCRVCGLIKKSIERMIEVVYNKPKKLRRTYMREKENEKTSRAFSGIQSSQKNILGEKMFIHPRHAQEMRPHQTEGFKFLCNNLAADELGGCVLAHAPGSGKTFLLISFLQSFMAMDPEARPLIVLPKGIIESWKREFTLWEVEYTPLLDFYSVKADSRKQQLEVLRKWVEQRSIMFLGYQQFARIICDDMNFDAASEDCKRILLERPTLLILDEGHTSRNKETNMLISLLVSRHLERWFSQVVDDEAETKVLSSEDHFSLFKRKFGKVYGSMEEHYHRFSVFKANLRRAMRHQKMDPLANHGVTQFSDLTPSEFRRKHLGFKGGFKLPEDANEAPILPTHNLTDDFDWRDRGAVTPVKNQGSCGSCWSFSTTGALEGAHFLATGKLVSLSEQQLVDCDHECDPEEAGSCDSGCNGGLMNSAFEYMLKTGGLMREEDYPYTGTDGGSCKLGKSKMVASVSNFSVISMNEDQIAANLVKNGPLAVAINAAYMQTYIGGVSCPYICSRRLNHGVLLVGYGSAGYAQARLKEKPYWIIKNSWGESWGENGFYKICKGRNICGVDSLVSTVTTAI